MNGHPADCVFEFDHCEDLRQAECVVVERVARDRHQCRLPGWRARRKMNLDFGSVVACSCGQLWRWDYTWADVSWMRVGGAR